MIVIGPGCSGATAILLRRGLINAPLLLPRFLFPLISLFFWLSVAAFPPGV